MLCKSKINYFLIVLKTKSETILSTKLQNYGKLQLSLSIEALYLLFRLKFHQTWNPRRVCAAPAEPSRSSATFCRSTRSTATTASKTTSPSPAASTRSGRGLRWSAPSPTVSVPSVRLRFEEHRSFFCCSTVVEHATSHQKVAGLDPVLASPL